MKKNKTDKSNQTNKIDEEVKKRIIRRKTIKEMIAPTGIDASSLDHLEVISNVNRFARSFFVANLPRMCTFPELFRGMYMFGDINTSVYINPIQESKSQNDLNRVINELETERIMAEDRGNINRARLLAQKTSEIGHSTGIPLGYNAQTGVPILFDNFHESLTNYNMVIFAKSGAGKSVTMKTLISRSAVLMGIESLALDAEGEYSIVADSLGGINVVISPNSGTVINLFDLETETVKDEITGKEKMVLNVESKIEDVTQALVTMAKGSTKSSEVNELTKQIIAESVADEYARMGITSDPTSLYVSQSATIKNGEIVREKKNMPTIGSWYRQIQEKAANNTNPDYQFHYSYLIKVMKQYIREYDGQMAYFDGQSTFDLLEESPFINLDISQLEERFARPLAQQILLSWIWEKYVKKNSEDRKKARKKRVLVDEAWMLLPYPEAVDFLNTMARRARKRNVSLAIISQRFQDFYEKAEVQAVLTSSDTKLFLAQDKAEIEYLKEVFKLSEGEAGFLVTCQRGQGLLKVGQDSAIITINPTAKEFQFMETNLNKVIAQKYGQ